MKEEFSKTKKETTIDIVKKVSEKRCVSCNTILPANLDRGICPICKVRNL